MRTARCSMAVCWGEGEVSATVHAGRPPQLWAMETPPATTCSNPPHWVWAMHTSLAMTPQIRPQCGPRDLIGMLGYPPPPWTEFLRHACENITIRQTSFAGGNNRNVLQLYDRWCSICADNWAQATNHARPHNLWNNEQTLSKTGVSVPTRKELMSSKMGSLEHIWHVSKIKMWHKTMQAHGISKHVLASFSILLVAHCSCL